MELLGTVVDLLTVPFAIYGVYVFLGFPPSDKITALGAKAMAWITSKFKG